MMKSLTSPPKFSLLSNLKIICNPLVVRLQSERSAEGKIELSNMMEKHHGKHDGEQMAGKRSANNNPLLKNIRKSSSEAYVRKVAKLCNEGPVEIPESLYTNPLVLEGISRVPNDVLARNTRTLRNYLWSRQPPTRDFELQKSADQVEQHLMSLTRQRIDLEKELEQPNKQNLTAEKELQLRKLEEQREMLASKILRQKIYHWKPIDYNAAMSVTYMYALMESHYAVLHKIFEEIHVLHPKFQPKSLLDFGSGLGTSIWASMHHWKTIRHAFAWDKSENMLFVSKELLNNLQTDSGETASSKCDFRRSDSEIIANKSKFDLVTSAYSLFELHSKQLRLDIISKLWNYTAVGGYLILVENGTKHGHALIDEARQHIIQDHIQDEKKKNRAGHIFSPCPHMKQCPRTQVDSPAPCNFVVDYYRKIQIPSEQSSSKSKQTHRCLYSYVVFKKGPQPDVVYPRALYNMTKAAATVTATACFPDGDVKTVRIDGTSSISSKRVIRLELKARGKPIPIVNEDGTTIC